MHRLPGGISGPLAVAPWVILAATIWTPPPGLLICLPLSVSSCCLPVTAMRRLYRMAKLVTTIFAARGEQPPLKLTWYSGGLHPPHPELLPQEVSLPSRGAMFVGEKGIILNDGGERAPQIYPESLASSFTPPKPTLARSNGHFRDWVDAIKGGPAASSNFDYAAPS